MSPETLALVKSIIPVISAILGTIVGVAGTIVVTFINKRSEEKKHLNSLSFNAGIANSVAIHPVAAASTTFFSSDFHPVQV